MGLPKNATTVGDGHNGIRMYEGERVYARTDLDLKVYLGTLRFHDGVPYLRPEEPNYSQTVEGTDA